MNGKGDESKSVDVPTVLYIGGAGRSGSTLLELLLGEVQGVFAAGEVTHLWNRGVRQNQLCGCQKPFEACEFWSAVRRARPRLFEHPDRMSQLRDDVCALHRLPQLRWTTLRSDRFEQKVQRYGDALVELYRAISEVSGSSVIIDSSKYPPEALLSSRRDDLHLVVAHLVRDSRAVAQSWTRHKVRPEIHWEEAFMPRYPPAQTAVAWNAFNLFFERLAGGDTPTTRVRYEDLITDPNPVLESVTRMVDSAPIDAGKPGDEITLSVNHTVSGNPTRFHDGSITLYHDEKWRRQMNRPSRALVTAITWPLLRRYGYV
ncbi:MAG: sulfotransferase [Persicimonas sp.]